MVDFSKLLKNSPSHPRLFTVPVEGIRIHHTTKDAKKVNLRLYLNQGYDNQTWINIEGGPTGYESMPLKSMDWIRDSSNGWHACAGTPGRWDTLIIQYEDLKKSVDQYNFLTKDDDHLLKESDYDQSHQHESAI